MSRKAVFNWLEIEPIRLPEAASGPMVDIIPHKKKLDDVEAIIAFW
jgi:hypothetical protein